MLLLPRLVFLQTLPTQVFAEEAGLLDSLGSPAAGDPILVDLRPPDQIRVAPGAELQRCNAHQREDDVGAVRPGKVLRLLDLHGEVHSSVVPLLPLSPAGLILGEPFPAPAPDGRQIISIQPTADILLIDQILIELQPSI